VAFIGDADMGGPAALGEPAGQVPVQDDLRAARVGIEDFALAPGHGPAHAQADGLGKGLFCRKPRGQVAQSAQWYLGGTAAVDPQFLGAQHFLGKAFAPPLKSVGDASHIAQIGANADDHTASVMRAFRASVLNSAMAWGRPTNTDRPISACPMCNSAACGSAATRAVLLTRRVSGLRAKPWPACVRSPRRWARLKPACSRPNSLCTAWALPDHHALDKAPVCNSTQGAPACAAASICRASASMNRDTLAPAAARRAQASLMRN